MTQDCMDTRYLVSLGAGLRSLKQATMEQDKES